MPQVSYAAPPPERKKSFQGHYGGSWPLIIEADGVYRICLDSKIWLDLVDTETGTPLSSNLFEMQTGCEEIFKVVTYTLEKGKKYSLQLAFAKNPHATVLITPHRSP
ncbi:hypothetical protein [Sulfidibacter corallicola]|uniref:Uncharacterized protein n=1 Tax=Sulfidibacter corallicola TaxID=2818388 RepID=A0A8A4TID5_SULCO|nr:hypothetical protein [Sulfidibacter corallicola]QTD49310.1 hypothetical protein J3U87_27305 [Sulfidibacter corallicola]